MKKPLKITLVIFLIVLGIGIILYYVLFLSPPLVHLSVSTDKNQYKVGEDIEITLRLYKNSLRKVYLYSTCDVYEQGFHPDINFHKKGESENLISKSVVGKSVDERIEWFGACFGYPGFENKFDVKNTSKIKIPEDVDSGEYIIESNYEPEGGTFINFFIMRAIYGDNAFKAEGIKTIIIEK